MDVVTALLTIRDNLRTNLSDPITLAGGSRGTGLNWIFYNEPVISKYPMIEIKKTDNPRVPISIGPTYVEDEQVFANVWIYFKNGFKFTVSGTEYVNSQAVEYMLEQVKSTLKTQFSTLFDAGVKNYKSVNTTPVNYDPETQLYFGAVTIRVQFFQGC